MANCRTATIFPALLACGMALPAWAEDDTATASPDSRAAASARLAFRIVIPERLALAGEPAAATRPTTRLPRRLQTTVLVDGRLLTTVASP